MNVGELIRELQRFPEYRDVEVELEVEDSIGERYLDYYPATVIFERQQMGSGHPTVVIR